MSPEEAITALDALAGDDPEGAHYRADEIVRSLLPPEVDAAYERVIDRCDWWAYA